MNYLMYRLNNNRSFNTYSHVSEDITQKDVDLLKKNLILWNGKEVKVVVLCLEDDKVVLTSEKTLSNEDKDIILKSNWKIKRSVK